MNDIKKTGIVWDTTTGQTLLDMSANDSPVQCVQWSLDGRFIASGHTDGTISIWDAESSVEAHRFKGHTDAVIQVKWSPDNSRIASSSADGTVRVWDTKTGDGRVIHTGPMNDVQSLQWSGDGKRLVGVGEVFANRNRDDPKIKRLSELLLKHPENLHVQRESFGVVVIREADETLLRFPRRVSDVSSVERSLNWLFVASGHEDGTLSLWDVEKGKEYLRISAHKGHIEQVSWSLDSRYVATKSSDGTICVWNARTGGRERLFSRFEESIESLAWPKDDDIDERHTGNGTPDVRDKQDREYFDGELPEAMVAEFPVAHDTVNVWRFPGQEAEDKQMDILSEEDRSPDIVWLVAAIIAAIVVVVMLIIIIE